jgi:hypothetical protein
VALTYPEEAHRRALDRMVGAMSRSNPAMAAAASNLRAFYDRHMSYPALRAEQVRAVRETYTAAEVQQLVAFYGSDAGRRIAGKAPLVAERAQERTMARLQALQGELGRVMSAAPTGGP